MSIKEKDIIVRWTSGNKRHYETKGYVFTKNFEEFEIKVGDLSKGSTIKITPICDECGKERKSKISYHAYNMVYEKHDKYICINCSRKNTMKNNILSIDEVKDRIYKIHGEKINIIEDTYVNSSTDAMFYCNICGRTFKKNINNIFNHKQGCPNCTNNNKHEKMAREILEQWLDFDKYKLETQKVFQELRYKNHLLFYDFCIIDIYTNTHYIIELHGQQHFEPVNFGGGKSEEEIIIEFNNLQTRDKIKKYFIEDKENSFYDMIPYTKYKKLKNALLDVLNNFGIKIKETPNELKYNYDYKMKFKVAEEVRRYKFYDSKNDTYSNIASIFELDKIFKIKISSCGALIREILNGEVYYENSKYIEEINLFRDLDKNKRQSITKRQVTLEEEKIICELYLTGLSCEKVGKQVGYSRKAVTSALLRNSIKLRDPVCPVTSKKKIS